MIDMNFFIVAIICIYPSVFWYHWWYFHATAQIFYSGECWSHLCATKRHGL